MSNNTFMDKLRTFFGLHQEPPKNDFRNPIWGTDDDDDGDELYTRQQIKQYDPMEFHRDMAKQMNDMFKSFGNLFGDMRSFIESDHFDEYAGFGDIPSDTEENYSGNNIRDYYLKPGYQNQQHEQLKQDIDLDGKISSNEISGLLKNKEDKSCGPLVPFSGDMIPGRSFCKTIITTSITKPDGTIETRKIVKNGNEVVETITSTEPDPRGPHNTASEFVRSPGFIYSHVMSELSSLFKNFY